jgi:hypothetical protein
LTTSFDKIPQTWKHLKSKLRKKGTEQDFSTDDPEDDVQDEEKEEIETDFSEPDSPDLIFLNSANRVLPIVKAGTEDRLIERLISEKYPGS